MATASPANKRIAFKGVLWSFFNDSTRFLDLEGALNCGKTTACLWKELKATQDQPGIWSYIGRYSDGDNESKLLPAWRRILDEAGVSASWDSKEKAFLFDNGSKVYSFGLKSPDALSRYSKLRGLGVARIYIDQAEELPPDFFGELVQRLRQPGYPQQLTLSPNPLEVDSWLAREFPDDNRIDGRHYYHVSLYDNAHNLPPEKIGDALSVYPEGHAKHRTMILGLRGMNVIGEPVYKGKFDRQLHEKAVNYDARLPLEMALDFGKHHPCVVFRQVSVLGQVRFLGGILGQNLYLDEFLDIVLARRQEWFPKPIRLKECCDPAGLADTSHGTKGASETLLAKGLRCRAEPDSNTPSTRLAVIERLAALMQRRAADRSEALVVSNDPEHWLRVSADGAVSDRFLAAGFEAGYVWDPHLISVANKQVRRPKKDGWYEHGQNCAEYLELNFGLTPPVAKPPVTPQAPPSRGEFSWMS